MAKSMTARYFSECRYCGGAIIPGRKIAKGPSGWGHPDCADVASDPDADAERRYFERFTAEYQMEVQGFVSSP